MNKLLRSLALPQVNGTGNFIQAMQQWNDALLQSQASSIKNLELQLGQLFSNISRRPKGSLPSNTETPNQVGGSGKEKCQVVTLRSRRNLTIREPKFERRNSTSTSTTKIGSASNDSNPLNSSLTNNTSSLQNKNIPNKEVESTRREEQRDEESHETTSSNPLSSPPFLGHLKKRATSNIFKNGVPEKRTGPGSFTIPCSIGEIDLSCALYDLRASINLMSLSIFKKLEIREVQPTHMRRSFLSTSQDLIDVHHGELSMRFNNEEIKFNVVNELKFSIDVENYKAIKFLRWDYCEEEVYFELF
ncbi:uncharacterized protein E5676_scaffold32G00540 [Cucumis melo var. makuwa]|uniref:Uncharacterized protein n=1 Tax=Cucumis melo var. makuwa TaxID=1194695 RepID=A0A5A7TGS2_CUCMM|nr:uncharacterized protein E6C27_scaffold128G002220 [Cucumis melo var. makuwa]TYK16045.1 uncharacterized protein E5676_scaffold32G00540 [Cucumis melo var. makuwa]